MSEKKPKKGLTKVQKERFLDDMSALLKKASAYDPRVAPRDMKNKEGNHKPPKSITINRSKKK